MINPFRQRNASRAAPAPATLDRPVFDAPQTDGDGLVRISLPSLLALRHAAEALPLKPGKIRAPGNGSYRSSFKGRGMEFDEVRPYMQGDDPRTLDWRVMARTGRPHTKLFREERERSVMLWLDLRSPMFFATRGAFKAVRAAQAAALFAWSASFQGDRLGALIFSEQTHIELRPRRGKQPLLNLLQNITDHSAWQEHKLVCDVQTSTHALSESLLRLRRVAQPGSLVILLSDLAFLDDQARAHLAQLSRHNDLILANIHDPLEAELPPPGRYRLSDGSHYLTMETGEKNLRERYRQRFAEQQMALQRLCRSHGINLMQLSTAATPLLALQRGLGVAI